MQAIILGHNKWVLDRPVGQTNEPPGSHYALDTIELGLNTWKRLNSGDPETDKQTESSKSNFELII